MKNSQIKAIFLLIFFALVTLSLSAKINTDGQKGYLPFAEVMPKPVGGLSELYKNIVYPQKANQAGVHGKVYVLVLINEKGGVDDVKVIKGIGSGCDKSAIKGLLKTKFQPGKNKGKAVKVKFSMAIKF